MPRLVLHSLAYLLLLVSALSIIPVDSSFSGDAGAYGGQVFALRKGDWALDRPVAVVAQEHEGWLNTAITPDGPTPYTANPGYALLLTGVVRLVHGEPDPAETAADLALGLRIVPVLSALLGAVAAWLLAARLHRPSAPYAFWLLALGPNLVNATTLWAHSLSTALGGLAVLAMLRATDRAAVSRPPAALAFAAPTATDHAADDDANEYADGAVATASEHGFRRSADPDADRAAGQQGPAGDGSGPAAGWLGSQAPALALLTMALVAGAAVRTEAIFWVTAVVAVGLFRTDRLRLRLALGAVGALSAVVWAANRWWGAQLRADRLPIETSIEALNDAPGWLAGRLPAAWMLLVNSPTGGPGPLLTVVAVAATGGAVLRIVRPDAGRIGPGLLLWIAVAAYVGRLLVEPGTTISGLVAAWPAMIVPVAAGLGRWLRPADDQFAAERRDGLALAATGAALIGFVLATQYASSGGLQWGGRYLSFAFAPMAAVAAVAGRSLVARRRLPLLALLLVPAAIGLSSSAGLHRHHDTAIEQASIGDPDVVITESVALPRIAWRQLPVAFYRADVGDIVPLLEQLAEAGVAVVNVHGLGGVDLDDVAGYQVTDLVGPVRRLELLLVPAPSG